MSYMKDVRKGAAGNTRLLKAYGAGSKGPRQCYAGGGAVGGNPSLDEGLASAGGSSTKGSNSKPGRKADGKHGKKSGKGGKTNVNVVIMQHPPGAGAAGPGAPIGPMPPDAAMAAPPPPPMPPPGPPPGAGMGPGGPGGPGGPPLMPRASGGRVGKRLVQFYAGGKVVKRAKGGTVPMTAGALGGEGRIQKVKEYGEGGPGTIKLADRMPVGVKKKVTAKAAGGGVAAPKPNAVAPPLFKKGGRVKREDGGLVNKNRVSQDSLTEADRLGSEAGSDAMSSIGKGAGIVIPSALIGGSLHTMGKGVRGTPMRPSKAKRVIGASTLFGGYGAGVAAAEPDMEKALDKAGQARRLREGKAVEGEEDRKKGGRVKREWGGRISKDVTSPQEKRDRARGEDWNAAMSGGAAAVGVTAPNSSRKWVNRAANVFNAANAGMAANSLYKGRQLRKAADEQEQGTEDRKRGGKVKRADGGPVPRAGGTGDKDLVSRRSLEEAQKLEGDAAKDKWSAGQLGVTGLGAGLSARSITKGLRRGEYDGATTVPRLFRGAFRTMAGLAGAATAGGELAARDKEKKAASVMRGEPVPGEEDRKRGGKVKRKAK